MPGLLEETRSVLHWLATELSPDTYVNLMDQYHPAHKAEMDPRFSELNRRISSPEFWQALAYAEEAGGEVWPAQALSFGKTLPIRASWRGLDRTLA
jgi:uncharacterized Fe-S radical SAM superfamily protein PflX